MDIRLLNEYCNFGIGSFNERNKSKCYKSLKHTWVRSRNVMDFFKKILTRDNIYEICNPVTFSTFSNFLQKTYPKCPEETKGNFLRYVNLYVEEIVDRILGREEALSTRLTSLGTKEKNEIETILKDIHGWENLKFANWCIPGAYGDPVMSTNITLLLRLMATDKSLFELTGYGYIHINYLGSYTTFDYASRKDAIVGKSLTSSCDLFAIEYIGKKNCLVILKSEFSSDIKKKELELDSVFNSSHAEAYNVLNKYLHNSSSPVIAVEPVADPTVTDTPVETVIDAPVDTVDEPSEEKTEDV